MSKLHWRWDILAYIATILLLLYPICELSRFIFLYYGKNQRGFLLFEFSVMWFAFIMALVLIAVFWKWKTKE